MKDKLAAIWNYRNFIATSIERDLRARFSRSRLGGLWMILNPLALVAMYALVLSSVLSAKLPGIESRYSYALYLTAGIFCWSMFSDLVSRCLTLFIDNANLLKKVAFPKICLPLIAAGSVLVNGLLLLLCVLLIFVLARHPITLQIAWLPLLVALTAGLGLGLGLILGITNVFIRDIGQAVPILLQFGFWFTPIVYMIDIIPPAYRGVLALNPMFHLVSGFQDVMVFNRSPNVPGLAAVAVVCLAVLSLAMFMFRKANAEMVDEL